MKIRSLTHGPHLAEFGRKRECKYKFEHTNPKDRDTPVVADVTDPEHAAALLALPEHYELHEPQNEDPKVLAALQGRIADAASRFAATSQQRAQMPPPIAILADKDEDYADVVVRIPVEMVEKVKSGEYEFGLLPLEEPQDERVEVQPLPDDILEELHSADITRLRAICVEHGINVNSKAKEDALRTAIREHFRLGAVAQAA